MSSLSSASGRLAGFFALFTLLVLGSCSPIMIESDDPVDRRVYTNDAAANDSLNREIARDGVKFVLQPGKPYTLSITTTRASDILEVNILQAGGKKGFKKIPAVHDGTRATFPITSTLDAANFFSARLLPAAGTTISAGSLQHVALESQGTVTTDTLHVKLLFIQQLTNLPDDASKASFAAAFFAQMNAVLKPYAIVVAGISEVVNGNQAPMNFPFTNTYVSLPGTRVANHAHLYLVDQITVGDPDTGPQGTVLGFAAREVVDISDHRESRVILSNPFSNRTTVNRVAVTAAHELGHFFGMRHTVSTRHDMLQDNDISNDEDGFTDTRMCRLDQATLKRSAASLPDAAPGEDKESPYCLRIAADNACSEPTCDLRNLMHPVECDGLTQTTLTLQQVAFMKRNMALYRR